MVQSDVNEVRKFIDEKMEEFKMSIDGYLNSMQKQYIGSTVKLDNRVNVIFIISRWALNNKVDIKFEQALELINSLSTVIEELKE